MWSRPPKSPRLALICIPLVLGACAGFPAPVERLASAEAAARSARELGAAKDPKAAYHLQLADDQLAQGKALLKEEDNKKADLVLLKAAADAELAVALAKEFNAQTEAEKAKDKVKSVKGAK
jgi:hypothetical protein